MIRPKGNLFERETKFFIILVNLFDPMLSKRKEINVMKVILYKYRFKWLDSETKTLNNAGLHLTIIIVSWLKVNSKQKITLQGGGVLPFKHINQMGNLRKQHIFLFNKPRNIITRYFIKFSTATDGGPPSPLREHAKLRSASHRHRLGAYFW